VGDQWRYRKLVTLPDGRSNGIVAGTPAMNTKRAAEEAERAHVERTINPPVVAKERRKMTDVFDRFVTDYVAIANNKESEKASKVSAIDCHCGPSLARSISTRSARHDRRACREAAQGTEGARRWDHRTEDREEHPADPAQVPALG